MYDTSVACTSLQQAEIHPATNAFIEPYFLVPPIRQREGVKKQQDISFNPSQPLSTNK